MYFIRSELKQHPMITQNVETDFESVSVTMGKTKKRATLTMVSKDDVAKNNNHHLLESSEYEMWPMQPNVENIKETVEVTEEECEDWMNRKARLVERAHGMDISLELASHFAGGRSFQRQTYLAALAVEENFDWIASTQ